MVVYGCHTALINEVKRAVFFSLPYSESFWTGKSASGLCPLQEIQITPVTEKLRGCASRDFRPAVVVAAFGLLVRLSGFRDPTLGRQMEGGGGSAQGDRKIWPCRVLCCFIFVALCVCNFVGLFFFHLVGWGNFAVLSVGYDDIFRSFPLIVLPYTVHRHRYEPVFNIWECAFSCN